MSQQAFAETLLIKIQITVLTRYLPKPKTRKEKKLLDNDEGEEDSAEVCTLPNILLHAN